MAALLHTVKACGSDIKALDDARGALYIGSKERRFPFWRLLPDCSCITTEAS
jgi:hypothetical protein